MREWLHSLRLRWRVLKKQRQLDRDLEEELAFHREMRAAKYAAQGETLEEARYRAERRFGNVTLTKETIRESWSFAWLDETWRDLQHAARSLRRSPGFALTAILTLALAIGANTSVFTVMNAIFLRSLPIRDPQNLRVLNLATKGDLPSRSSSGYGNNVNGIRTMSSISYPMLQEVRRLPNGFPVAGFANITTNAAARSQAQVVRAQFVTDNYFDVLGAAPVLGRAFRPEEDRSGDATVVIISHRLWERLFHSDAAALGSTLQIERKSYTVVGVMGPGVQGMQWPGQATDVFMPLTNAPAMTKWYSLTDPDRLWVQSIGRVAPGADESKIRASIDVLLNRHTQDFNTRSQNKKAHVPWIVLVKGGSGLGFVMTWESEFLMILMSMVGMVLLIACANVANLLLARGTARGRELAVRQSLGAGRWRIVRHLLTEAGLLAIAGGALGMLLARLGTQGIGLLMRTSDDSTLDLSPDLLVMFFTMGLSIATALLFGMLPAFRATRVQAVSCLRQGGADSGTLRQGLAKTLVLVQVTVGTILVVGAGLSARTLLNLNKVELGFRAERLLLFYLDPSRNGYKDQQAFNVYRQIRDKLAAIPGVTGVTMSDVALISHSMSNSDLFIPGYSPKGAERPMAYVHTIGPNFLSVMGTPVLLGRELNETDSETAPQAAVVNQTLVKKYFEGTNPIGREFSFGDKMEKPIRIVGVAGDAKYHNLRDAAPPTVYVSYAQGEHAGSLYFELRTATEPTTVIAAARRAVAEVDPLLPLAEIRTQEQQISESLSRERTFAALASFFSLAAIALAAIGLYGVLSYAVTRRTSEFGVRMALGASSANVMWLAVRGSLWVVCAGVLLGIPVALACARLIESRLYGVKPVDPWSCAIAGGAMLITGLLAATIPGRRASRCDPSTALRYE